MPYNRQFILKTPAPVSCVSLFDNQLAIGADDGSIRFYELPDTRVTKAIRGFDTDVPCIVWTKRTQQPQEVWIASGTEVYKFSLDPNKMIMSKADATAQIRLGEDEEDVVNELGLSDNQKFLVFGTDAGTVGTVELATQQVTKMRGSHTSICSSAKFVPDRPSEVISGGYDSALLHFDFKQGNILSRFDIAAAPPTTGVSMSPPFILSVSISPNGLIAATTADGRVWVGTGGDKASPTARKKRSRKWEGLREADGTFAQIADGPVVGSAFTAPTTLVTCSLLGKVAEHTVTYAEDSMPRLNTTWTSTATDLAKVNALTASAEWLIIGGFSEDGKGVAEVWKPSVGEVTSSHE